MTDNTFLKTFEDLLLDQKDQGLADTYLQVYGDHRNVDTSIDITWESLYKFSGDLLYLDEVAFEAHKYSTAGLYVTKIDDDKFPLYHAVKNLRLSFISYFLEQGADVNATYKTNEHDNNMLNILAQTPWDEKKQAIIDKLKEHGINVDHKNKFGMNSIVTAVNYGHSSDSMINALKNIGCVIPTCPDPTTIGVLDDKLPYLKQINSNSCFDDDLRVKDHIVTGQAKKSWKSKCNISCQDGFSMNYLPDDNPDQETGNQIICDRYGEWAPLDKSSNVNNTLNFEDFECTGKPCGPPGNSTKANFDGNDSVTCSKTDYLVGTTCSMSCLAGHYAVAYDYANNQNDVQYVSSMDQPFAECVVNPSTLEAEWDFNYRCEKVQCTNVAHIQGILMSMRKEVSDLLCIDLNFINITSNESFFLRGLVKTKTCTS